MSEEIDRAAISEKLRHAAGHPWFDHWFSLFPSYRAIIRVTRRRTTSIRRSNGLWFRSLGLLRSRQPPLSVPGTRGLRVLTIRSRSYRIRLHESACSVTVLRHEEGAISMARGGARHGPIPVLLQRQSPAWCNGGCSPPHDCGNAHAAIWSVRAHLVDRHRDIELRPADSIEPVSTQPPKSPACLTR